MDLLAGLQIPTNRLDLFIRTVEISSYLPGRVRLHLKKMIGNAALEREVRQYLMAIKEIEQVETSLLTGSILLTYQPDVLRRNAELAKVERYIMAHVKGR